jgi:hypothetical protein
VRAVAPDDAEHRSLRTVTRIARRAQITAPATGVNLPDHSPAHKLRRARRPLHHANEFMPERALEASVPARNLDIRIADAAQRHTHQSLKLITRRRNICDRHPTIFITKRKHKNSDK